MQQSESTNSFRRPIRHGRWVVGLLVAGLAVTSFLANGCGPDSSSPDPKPSKPYSDVTLTIRCADPQFAAAISPPARSWAARTGATVHVTSAAQEHADILVLAAAEVGHWAARDELISVPLALREAGHPFQWGNVLSVYRGEQLAGWGGQIVALPLAGDGHVFVFRTDRFTDPVAAYVWELETDRELSVPTTWEEYAEIAAFFSRFDGKPALPPLPPDADRLTDHFFRVAACYDRAVLGESGVGVELDVDPLAFQFRTDTGQSRLGSPGFKKAAAVLGGLKQKNALPNTTGEPAEALGEGRAVMGVLSLTELAALQRGTAWNPSRFGVAPLPGTRSYFDATGREQSTDANYVPYFSGGQFGVVRKSCAQIDAAFDLLAEIGGPTRSLEIIGTPGLGAGPFRNSHLDRDRLLIWLGYGLDESGSKSLQEALRANLGQSVRNPVFGLRGPDRTKLTTALGSELKAIGNGSVPPDVGLDRAVKAWNELDAGMPAEQLRQWRRRAVGLN